MWWVAMVTDDLALWLSGAGRKCDPGSHGLFAMTWNMPRPRIDDRGGGSVYCVSP